MRIILSEGRINIFNLREGCVEQIERFYTRNLPLSRKISRTATRHSVVGGDCFEAVL
jgi:hypothetical protein